jgi:hypothetical protein
MPISSATLFNDITISFKPRSAGRYFRLAASMLQGPAPAAAI